MAQITPLSLYIINRAKFLALVSGILPSKLSVILKHDDSYVSNIEKEGRPDKYPPHEYPKLAKALKVTIHDILPPDDMDQTDDGTLVDKIVLSLDREQDMLLVLNGLIDYNYFDERITVDQAKTLADIIKHLDLKDKDLKAKANLETMLNQLVKEGKLELAGDRYSKSD